MPDIPLSLEVLPVATALRPGGVSAEFAVIRIRAAAMPQGARPRLTAVLVLDVSGSMQGEPLEHVRQSAQRLAEILDDDDRLGVVAFSDAAQTTSPVRAMTPEARRAALREIAALRPLGGTNVSAGLAHAALAFPVREPGERQIALLLSDGQPNRGTSTPAGLLEEARRIKARGIAVSTLGYGVHHTEEVLIAIAEGGGGRYAFVSDPRLAGGSFARALGAQRDVVAEDVSVTIAPADGVEIARVYGDPPVSFGASGLRVTLQDLIAGDELNVVVELKVAAPREAGPWQPLAVALAARRAGGTGRGMAAGGGYRAAATSDEIALRAAASVTLTHAGPFEERLDALVAATIARADEARARARALADGGNFAGAVEVLRGARDTIAQVPGFAPGGSGRRPDLGAGGPADPLDALADAYETLVDDIDMLARKPQGEQYAAYKKAARDYNDFAQGGTRARGGTGLMAQTPSAQDMARRSVAMPLPEAVLVCRVRQPDGSRTEDTVVIRDAEFSIGRGMTNHLPLAVGAVSKNHARIVFNANQYFLVDLGSTNGSAVNGEPVRAPRPLRPGDLIQIGDAELEFQLR